MPEKGGEKRVSRNYLIRDARKGTLTQSSKGEDGNDSILRSESKHDERNAKRHDEPDGIDSLPCTLVDLGKELVKTAVTREGVEGSGVCLEGGRHDEPCEK